MAKWTLLYAYNGTASSKNFRAFWYDASENVESAVVYDYSLTSKNLDEHDEIRVLIETGATNASCIVTLELEQRSTVQNFI